MHPRARQLIDRLGLVAHPEGGYYRRLFVSAQWPLLAGDYPELV